MAGCSNRIPAAREPGLGCGPGGLFPNGCRSAGRSGAGPAQDPIREREDLRRHPGKDQKGVVGSPSALVRFIEDTLAAVTQRRRRFGARGNRDSHSGGGAVASPKTLTIQQQVEAATAVAERIAAAPGVAALPGEPDSRVALILARPEIKSIADLSGRTVAIDQRQVASRNKVWIAMVAAGAARVLLSDSEARPVDRLIGGDVPAAVLTLVSAEAAGSFPTSRDTGSSASRWRSVPSTPSRTNRDARHSAACEARTRNLEIPGSMLSHRPGMTKDGLLRIAPE